MSRLAPSKRAYMYRSLYNMDSKPFAINPDPAFLWLGEKHKEALSVLKYGILENKGFLLLTGEAGIGKTIVVDALVRGLDKNVKWAVIENPSLERIDFYNAIARGFGIEKQFTSKVQFLIRFSHYLHKMSDEGQKVLLLIDDCHLLSQDMLEELRLLSNIEKEDVKLVNIFFIGQPVFHSMLVLPKNRAIRQRLNLRSEILPLNSSESADYITHRLKVAGSEEKIFTTKALKAIAKYSHGFPRWINIICDHALVAGLVQGKSVVNHKIIAHCVQKLDLSLTPGRENTLENFNEASTVPTVPARPSVVPPRSENTIRNRVLIYTAPCVILLVLGTYIWSIWQHSDKGITADVFVKNQQSVVENIVHVTPPSVVEPPLMAVEAGEAVANVVESTEVVEFVETEEKTQAKDAESIVLQTDNAPEENVAPLLVDGTTPLEEPVQPEKIDKVQDNTEEMQENVGSTVVEDALPVVDIQPLSIEMQPDEETKVVQLAPLEPKKIILALQPNSLQLTKAAVKDFDAFIAKLVLYPRATLLVKGFVSSKSNSPENIKLSEDRAKNVQKLLVVRGISADRVQLLGMGNREPLASNTTSAGRRKNRRVEIIVVDDGR